MKLNLEEIEAKAKAATPGWDNEDRVSPTYEAHYNLVANEVIVVAKVRYGVLSKGSAVLRGSMSARYFFDCQCSAIVGAYPQDFNKAVIQRMALDRCMNDGGLARKITDGIIALASKQHRSIVAVAHETVWKVTSSGRVTKLRNRDAAIVLLPPVPAVPTSPEPTRAGALEDK